jgi:hypothetical protein
VEEAALGQHSALAPGSSRPLSSHKYAHALMRRATVAATVAGKPTAVQTHLLKIIKVTTNKVCLAELAPTVLCHCTQLKARSLAAGVRMLAPKV